MKYFSSTEDLKLFEIEVTQRISQSNIRNFLLSFFKIQNITYKNSDKIFLNYIKELKLYQIFFFNEEEKYFDFQIFEQYYKNIKTEDSIDLYICNNFFCLYKNGEFYYLQKITLEISNDEFIEFINKKFNIQLTNYKFIDDETLNELRDSYLKQTNKRVLKVITLEKNHGFYFYILYVVILINIAILYLSFDSSIEEKTDVIDNNLQIEKLKKEYEFLSLEEKITPLLEKLDSNNLELISLEFNQSRLKMVIKSSFKDEIYSFLEENRNILLSSSIHYLENQNLYEVVVNVKLFK
jgi:hypothetical protein